MSEAVLSATSSHRGARGVSYTVVTVIFVAAVMACFFFNKLGYESGYRTAYTSEHSHYLFEKSRGDKMHKRISVQQKCMATMIASVPNVTNGGFAGLGQMMNALGRLFGGSVRCNRNAGFGAITPEQYQQIMGRAAAQ